MRQVDALICHNQSCLPVKPPPCTSDLIKMQKSHLAKIALKSFILYDLSSGKLFSSWLNMEKSSGHKPIGEQAQAESCSSLRSVKIKHFIRIGDVHNAS